MKKNAPSKSPGRAIVAAPAHQGPLIASPMLGNLLSIAAGLSFLFLCMILPLVGPAAMRGSGSPGAAAVPHARANILAFTAVLLLSLALSVVATISKLERRKADQSPIPLYSIGLCAVLVFLLIALVAGLLQI